MQGTGLHPAVQREPRDTDFMNTCYHTSQTLQYIPGSCFCTPANTTASTAFRLQPTDSGIVRLLLFISLLLLSGCLPQGKAPGKSVEVANKALYSAHFSQDGQSLLVGSLYNGGSLWSTAPLERHFDWNHQADGTSGILGSAFSEDGRYAASNDSRTIVLWNRKTGEAISYWTAPGVIESMQLNRDGSLALLGLEDNSATLFDIQKGGIRGRFPHNDIVYSVAMSSNGLLAVSGCADRFVRIWKTGQTQPLYSLDQGNQVRTVAMSADGRMVFASAIGEPGRIIEASSGRVIAELPELRGYYSAARFSASGDQLLVGTTDGQISLWQSTDGSKIREWYSKGLSLFANTRTRVEDVGFARDGTWMAVTNNGQLHYLEGVLNY
jgi:WD40 repeat protein